MRAQLPFSRSNWPPLWREARIGLEAAALARSSIFRGDGMADGRGRPVLLIPGFLAGDGSLSVMANWLRRAGYRPGRAGIRANVDCSGAALGRLEERLETLVAKHGQPAAIVGQSRGGGFAKVLAARRPDLVRGVVTLGSPQTDPLAVHPLVRVQVGAVGALGALGAPGMLGPSCLNGDCCADFWANLSKPLPKAIGLVSVYSRSDGIVDWRSCLDPDADQHVEIQASHCGMAVSPAAYEAVAAALEGFAREERRLRAPARQSRAARRRAAA
jgi:triacylglycerol lipase